ncbi:MAG: rubrerythrin family protein [Prevotella sp.]|nr:rubrerythrin family protein [Prevotella sp.]MCM1074534.1 rubrerythrin family protein [Ruminococcus sp.]
MKPVNFYKADKSLAGTKTLENLTASYAAESMAYTRYNFYASQAEADGYYPVSAIFKETADNEMHHGKVFFKYLQDGELIPVNLPAVAAGVISDTSSNLKEAAREEESEGVDSYVKAAEVAKEEGFPIIAAHFAAIAKVEAFHKARFDALREMVDNGTMWKREKPIKWQCMVCGYVSEGTEPPKVCPACNHPYQHARPLEGI